MLTAVVVVSVDVLLPLVNIQYVCFIYIHAYPDNEALNPGDPAVRTMNPITSCLPTARWDVADSETDGRGPR